MKIKKVLKIDGTLLDKEQLNRHLQKIASNHNLKNKSQKETYPIPRLLENYRFIKYVYDILNEHVKLELNIHPAGEWLLDNFYIIEETIKQIQKEMSITKYINFIGIANGKYKGYARIYVLASEIVAYTDCKISVNELEEYLLNYQMKKALNMDEIWNIGLFLQIALIEKISEVVEKILNSQFQKYKAENIVERLVENKSSRELKFKNVENKVLKSEFANDMSAPFVEYMSFILKRYGKKCISYLDSLEEAVELTGSTVSEMIKKEHFNIAMQKVLIGNAITSIKKIQRINFLEIFERINGVEEILKNDPAKVYSKMDYKTKDCYRGKIKEIAKETKISEIYIARKILELANEKEELRKRHIGYFLIDNGINELYEALNFKCKKKLNNEFKFKIYICIFVVFTIFLSILFVRGMKLENIFINIISLIFIIVPISEIVIQIMQYILSKYVKPKLIPKIDFSNGIDKENITMVIIPSIVDSVKKVQELMKNLEVYYLANKSENIYFTLLGDCSESNIQETPEDENIISAGYNMVDFLNKKYEDKKFPKFNFIYRKREWNEKEEKYLGWERKRGMIVQFNEYILGNILNPFRVNTIKDAIQNNKNIEIPKFKYIITLDSDTELVLNTAPEMVGAMAHILNKPEIDEQKNIVVKGHAILQPRIGVNLNISYENLFTKIFAGSGGIDSYTNAISDTYQDNFDEGIFTGKGIYDIEVFSKVLSKRFPENTVLSHDLLEGNFLRCALASDIVLMDGYPTKYLSFMSRLSRWIRGDWQIAGWIKDKNLNLLSKFKIFDNLRRSVIEIFVILSLINIIILSIFLQRTFVKEILIILLVPIFASILELVNRLISKREDEQRHTFYANNVSSLKGTLLRIIINLGVLPYKAYISLKSIGITIYRMLISKKHLLEWITAEEGDKKVKTDVKSYFNIMYINMIMGFLAIVYAVCNINFYMILLGVLWFFAPGIVWYISRIERKKNKIEEISEKEKNYVFNLGTKTWKYFEDYLKEENNYLIPDNFQEDRKQKTVGRTSSTNIGLSMLAVISANDLKYIDEKRCIKFLENIINTVMELPKWNGHLYNWYNIKTKEPLIPRYVSTVDSGNFVGYLYVVKSFLENVSNKFIVNAEQMLENVKELIDKTDFSKLYREEIGVFSIGFNIEENRLTDSYYDLLASEARQASFVAIAKKDVMPKHWNYLSRTLTAMGKRRGLVSWSGTAFEYLMPNINIPKYEGSLLDETCKFIINSQIEYSKKFNLPWGISEAAFNLKDLNFNYQYKAFGIPWVGLKRGLADEMVVASYASILAITDYPKEVIKNLKNLENYGAYGKYGFYESIDFTPERVDKNKKYSIVKTYMAHHQSLILLSINNLFNDDILQKRFIRNPEIKATSILLQEVMPEKSIITKEKKAKVEKLRYKDYEDYMQNSYTKIDENFEIGNVISNENYYIAMNQKGEGVSKYKDIYINRFKSSSDYNQGIFFTIKNIKTKEIWSSRYKEGKGVSYKIDFMPDKIVQEQIHGNIKSKIKIGISANDPVEIRSLILENLGDEEVTLEVTSYFEPVLSSKEQDYSHQAFNNLFLVYEYDDKRNNLIVKRRARSKADEEIYLAVSLSGDSGIIGELEYEIDQEKFFGRGNLEVPELIEKSIPFSKQIGLTTEGVVALKCVIKLQAKEKSKLNLELAVGDSKGEVTKNIEKYKNKEIVEAQFELSKARVQAESRYLRIKGKDIELFQRMLSYIIFDNPFKNRNIINGKYNQEELWKYGISGDFPIILLKVKDANDEYIIKELLKGYEFFRNKNVIVELVILNEEKYSYENYVGEAIESSILNNQMGYLKNIRGGIFVLNKSEIDNDFIKLLEFIATFIIDSKIGNLANWIKEHEEMVIERIKNIPIQKMEQIYVEEQNDDIDILKNCENLKYYNEYGAFSADGKEYLIRASKNNRLPTVWSHIMANEKFGTVVTDSMGGYSWYKNSRLNRVSAWNNSMVRDIPSEIIYLKDEENGKIWSLGLNPAPDDRNYNVVYGFGYAKFIHRCNGLEQELDVFVPKEDACKVNILNLKNMTPNKKKLKIYYYIKPVIGEDEEKTKYNINLMFDKNSNVIFSKNLYSSYEDDDIVYVSSSEFINSYTGNKKFFIGNGSLKEPQGICRAYLNCENAIGRQACIAFEVDVEIESFSNKEISLILGADSNEKEAKCIAYKYSKIQNCKQELKKIRDFWKEILEKVQFNTPLESANILLNGWLIYQTIESRILGRSGYYQSGGAFGFRDQLQDALGLKYISSDFMKNQIIKHSNHQFLEGDVEHWWHEENGRGIRTKFSDDLIWLVYVTAEYIQCTGDKNILNINTSYLWGEKLKENEDERYDKYDFAKIDEKRIEENIYTHCIKAINRILSNFGENGLPKIGSGDWNDGFSNVGPKGKGESVWLGFFLYDVLDKFSKICIEYGDEKKGIEYENVKNKLRKVLNTICWDGRWYKRAFMDDGNELGTMSNDECKIDSIAQSWSVISNAGDNDKKFMAMESLENYLVDRENGIIKLLDPPFDKGKLEPGYIKGYLPGVRENGGQYTHE